ncbi:MAG: iron-sulfur cluster insertion protein ErpA [Acidimicrobiia bacterium]|jgi:iron-sulfur cluster assembly protein/iron-sulfur cluster insertion protein|nr:iron-sulfur cluster insertion protein ErpA [Acidimicrobiia bacterium]
MLTLTPPAAAKVKSLIEQEGDMSLALRVAVKPGGCSGFSYEMFFDGDFGEADQVAEFDGVKVVVDSDSAPHLEGAEVDYRDGLQGAGFAINNPNVSRTCGCGSSFS